MPISKKCHERQFFGADITDSPWTHQRAAPLAAEERRAAPRASREGSVSSGQGRERSSAGWACRRLVSLLLLSVFVWVDSSELQRVLQGCCCRTSRSNLRAAHAGAPGGSVRGQVEAENNFQAGFLSRSWKHFCSEGVKSRTCSHPLRFNTRCFLWSDARGGLRHQ